MIVCESCKRILEEEGYEVETALSGREAFDKMKTTPVDIVITDLKMPGIDGMEVLKTFRKEYPDTIVIMITGFSTVETAVEAMKLGAFDYIPKPFTPDEVSIVVKKGNELIARAIHFNSVRRDKQFVPVDCAVLSENLLESELFGHVRGSFTGAVTTKPGLFEVAAGGTVFLDGGGNISLSIPPKLLRVLQEREFTPVGGTKAKRVDIRLVAATNKDLEKMIKEGTFREDLYYRLNILPTSIPLLRERQEDIPMLAVHFLKKYAEEMGKTIKGFTPEAMGQLMKYPWPGNVRELG